MRRLLLLAALVIGVLVCAAPANANTLICDHTNWGNQDFCMMTNAYGMDLYEQDAFAFWAYDLNGGAGGPQWTDNSTPQNPRYGSWGSGLPLQCGKQTSVGAPFPQGIQYVWENAPGASWIAYVLNLGWTYGDHSNCQIHINLAFWNGLDRQEKCAVEIHEWGHLLGWKDNRILGNNRIMYQGLDYIPNVCKVYPSAFDSFPSGSFVL